MKCPPSSAEPAENYVLPPINAPHLSTREMNLLDQAFLARVEKTRYPSHRISRLRLWFVFLLARHAALRLGEILGLDDEKDIDLDTGVLRVSGGQARDVPLPAVLVSELRRLFAQPLTASQRGKLGRLDPGYVRRNFYDRARECGLPPELSSPRALRQSRAVELIQGGMPLPAVQKLLGQPSLESTGEFLAYTEADIKAMTRHYMHRETKLKTSARNVFPGRVDRVLRSGFLAEIRLTSFSGLQLVALITGESLENLQLCKGKTVIATVKATWVSVSREKDGGATSVRNHFPGRVSRIKRSEIVSEVEVALPGGGGACALITTESADAMALAPGDPVTVLFKAFSVVLAVP
jgi:molybdate transport system regulatory protein